jgi:hypothetical protein
MFAVQHNCHASPNVFCDTRELLITPVIESECYLSKCFRISVNEIFAARSYLHLVSAGSPQKAAGLAPKGGTSDDCGDVEMCEVLTGVLVAVNKTQRLIQQNVYSGPSPYATSVRQKVTLSLVRSPVVISRSYQFPLQISVPAQLPSS